MSGAVSTRKNVGTDLVKVSIFDIFQAVFLNLPKFRIEKLISGIIIKSRNWYYF
jgi:hypothetical protein